METDNIPARYSFPPGMRKESVWSNTIYSIYMSITIKNILAFTYSLSNTDKKSIYKYYIYNLIKAALYF